MKIKAALLLALIAMPAFAEDEGLYPAPPPAGAAWVRNLGEGSFSIGSQSMADKAYHMVMQGRYEVDNERLNIKAGLHYSVIRDGSGKPLLRVDPELENRARSLLVFYNLSEQPALELATADDKLTIISGVMQQEMASRMVQPMPVELAIRLNGRQAVKLQSVVLKRGAVYSIIATGTGDTVKGSLMENTTAQK